MRKDIIACLLIVTIIAFTMLTLQTSIAQQHCIDGEDLSYYESVTLGLGNPWYCECNHDVWEGDPEDSMAGLSLQAQYYTTTSFNWAQWCFEKQWGSSDVTSFDGMYIDPCVNGNDHHYYTDYTAPTWGIPPLAWFYCNYVYRDVTSSINPASSVEASCTGVFYHPSDPPWPPVFGDLWYMEAYTQNPPYDPYGNGWSYLYAHP